MLTDKIIWTSEERWNEPPNCAPRGRGLRSLPRAETPSRREKRCETGEVCWPEQSASVLRNLGDLGVQRSDDRPETAGNSATDRDGKEVKANVRANNSASRANPANVRADRCETRAKRTEGGANQAEEGADDRGGCEIDAGGRTDRAAGREIGAAGRAKDREARAESTSDRAKAGDLRAERPDVDADVPSGREKGRVVSAKPPVAQETRNALRAVAAAGRSLSRGVRSRGGARLRARQRVVRAC